MMTSAIPVHSSFCPKRKLFMIPITRGSCVGKCSLYIDLFENENLIYLLLFKKGTLGTWRTDGAHSSGLMWFWSSSREKRDLL